MAFPRYAESPKYVRINSILDEAFGLDSYQRQEFLGCVLNELVLLVDRDSKRIPHSFLDSLDEGIQFVKNTKGGSQ